MRQSGLRWVAAALVTALAVAWLSRVDTAAVQAAAGALGPQPLLGAVVVFLLVHDLRCRRFAHLMGQTDIRAAWTVGGVGFMAINTLPLRLGEGVRPWLMVRRGGTWTEGAAAVAVERLWDAVGLGALAVVSFGGLGWARPEAAWVALGVGAVGVGAVAWGREGIQRGIERGSPTWAVTLRPAFDVLARASADPREVLWVGGLTVGIWLGSVVWVGAVLTGMPGMPPGPAVVGATWVSTLMGMAVAPTPGFVGGFEAACATALSAAGQPWEQAMAAAVVLHGVHLGFTVLVGLPSLAIEALRGR